MLKIVVSEIGEIVMKHKLIKIVPTLLMGLSLSACTLLSDMGIGNGGMTKLAKYKHEVTFAEFRDKLVEHTKKLPYANSTYTIKDTQVEAEVKANVKQKVTNNTYKDKTRNEATAKASVSAKVTYDADHETFAATAKAEASLKEKSAVYGEADASYKGSFDFAAQPGTLDRYVIINKEDKSYLNVQMPENFSMNKTLSDGIQTAMKYVNETLPQMDQTIVDSYIDNMGYGNVSIKFYADNNVMTVVADIDNISNRTYYEFDEYTGTYKELVYAQEHTKLQVVFQAKVVKVLKVRYSVEGTVEADYLDDHNAILGGFFPTVSGIITNACTKGDKEILDIDYKGGLNYQEKKVNNKVLDLSKYHESKY